MPQHTTKIFRTFTTTKRRATSVVIGVLTCILLSACSGVPLKSIPRLLDLNSKLLDAKPREFMVAIQLDARMALPSEGTPVMEVMVEPTVPGAFEIINKKLPLRLNGTGADTNTLPRTLGLEDASKGRRWLVYSLTTESQAELQRTQTTIKRLMQDKKDGNGPGKGGGRVSVGIAQESIPPRDPAFANIRWESWLQTRQSEGFFEFWSGTVGLLLKQADARK